MKKEITWEIQIRDIKSLNPYYKNPRTLTENQEQHLSTSIEKFGLIDKPIINSDGTIIGGHQRLQVLKKMKKKKIEVMVPSRQLDDKEVEELNIRLNKNTGDWDWDCLANQWDKDDLVNWGFSEEEFFGTDVSDIDEIQKNSSNEEESDESKKKKHLCPQCGFEFS